MITATWPAGSSGAAERPRRVPRGTHRRLAATKPAMNSSAKSAGSLNSRVMRAASCFSGWTDVRSEISAASR